MSGGGTLTKWQYKQKEGNNSFDANWTDISETSTTLSHVVSGLDNSKSYQYKVRAVNATGDSAASAESTAASPTVVTLGASSVTHDSATLTIANWSGDWYHKRTAPTTPTASCSSVVSSPTKTASLSSLSGNTDYTWKAYSDSGCSTELASDDFLTKPDQPAKPTASGAGSGKLKLSASVNGSGTISKWQAQQKAGGGTFGSWQDLSNSGSTSLNHTFNGLTDGTSYQFKVRAVNATGNSAASAASDAKQPTAVTLTASAVGTTTATLTIGGHPGDWYYRADQSPYDSCSTVVSARTASLGGLSENTSYVLKAYSDSGCGTEIASETFRTLRTQANAQPSPPSSPSPPPLPPLTAPSAPSKPDATPGDPRGEAGVDLGQATAARRSRRGST